MNIEFQQYLTISCISLVIKVWGNCENSLKPFTALPMPSR